MTPRAWATPFILAALLGAPASWTGETPATADPVRPPAQTSGFPADTQTPGKDTSALPVAGAAVTSASASAADSISRAKSRADTVLVMKHSFNHREQIITGSVVMACLALMLAVMNNYNPR